MCGILVTLLSIGLTSDSISEKNSTVISQKIHHSNFETKLRGGFRGGPGGPLTPSQRKDFKKLIFKNFKGLIFSLKSSRYTFRNIFSTTVAKPARNSYYFEMTQE